MVKDLKIVEIRIDQPTAYVHWRDVDGAWRANQFAQVCLALGARAVRCVVSKFQQPKSNTVHHPETIPHFLSPGRRTFACKHDRCS